VPDIDEDRFSFSGPSLRPVAPATPFPRGSLRLHAAGNDMSLDVETNTGRRTLFPQTNVDRAFGISFVPNMRRPFVMRVSRDTFTLDVSGVRIMDIRGVGLNFERGSVRFQQFGGF
jgi:hypothetical protein